MKPHVTWLSIVFMLAGLVGCSPPPATQETELPPPLPVETIQETLDWARDNFKTVEQLNVNERYSQDFQKAREELVRAEKFLQEHLYEQAYTSSLTSVAASQRILNQFYQQTIVSSAQEAKAKIQELAQDDPDNPLNEFLPDLNAILDFSEKVVTGQKVEAAKILADLNKIDQINYATATAVKQTVESDVSFEPGKYDLSQKGKQFFETFAREIVLIKKQYGDPYPEKVFSITLKVVGYSDQTPFNEGTNLLKQLMKGVENHVPKNPLERRRFLNQRLSELRAKTISDQIVQFITQEDAQIQIKQEIVGLGEDVPPGMSPSYASDVSVADANRRICKIYAYITLQ